jgi:hypothetical protein
MAPYLLVYAAQSLGQISRTAIVSPTDMAVIRVIKDFRTGMFYAFGKWTKYPRLAQVFPDEESIKALVETERIQNAEMTYLSGDRRKVQGGQRIPCPTPRGG